MLNNEKIQKDIFAHEYHTNRKTATQTKVSLKDLDIGEFFYNYRYEFYGIKLSRFMYFNLDNNSMCRLNVHDSEIKMLYHATYEVY